MRLQYRSPVLCYRTELDRAGSSGHAAYLSFSPSINVLRDGMVPCPVRDLTPQLSQRRDLIATDQFPFKHRRAGSVYVLAELPLLPVKPVSIQMHLCSLGRERSFRDGNSRSRANRRHCKAEVNAISFAAHLSHSSNF